MCNRQTVTSTSHASALPLSFGAPRAHFEARTRAYTHGAGNLRTDWSLHLRTDTPYSIGLYGAICSYIYTILHISPMMHAHSRTFVVALSALFQPVRLSTNTIYEDGLICQVNHHHYSQERDVARVCMRQSVSAGGQSGSARNNACLPNSIFHAVPCRNCKQSKMLVFSPLHHPLTHPSTLPPSINLQNSDQTLLTFASL